MFQHGTRPSIYFTYMLYMMIATFNMCGTRQKYGIHTYGVITYHGLSLYILVNLTNSKSAKLCTKLAVLIITHRL